ncbi:hypothetical protein N324_11758, partial [Chlamydotis macqueenii]
KNSNLRFTMQSFPGEVVAEVAALLAARESSAAKIHHLQSALKSIADEIEALDEKQNLRERQNAALWNKNTCRYSIHKKVDLLNERVAMKVNRNVLLIETCDKTRDAEREIIRVRAA